MAYVLFVGRVLFAVFFADSAVRNLRRRGSVAERLAGANMPAAFRRYPAFFSLASSLLLLAGSVMVVAGAYADLGALCLAAFLVPTTYASHPFWRYRDPTERQRQRQGFLRNVSFFGGCLVLFALFAAYGRGLPLTLTEPLFDLR